MNKSILIVILALVLIMGLIVPSCAKPAPAPGVAPTAAPPGTEYQYKWRVSCGHTPEMDSGKSIIRLCDKVRERTDGRVDITPYLGGVLGSWDMLNEMLIRGDLEVMFEALDDSFDPRIAIGYYFPYLYKGYDEAERMWSPGGLVYTILNEITTGLGYRTLGAFAAGISGLTIKDRPPEPGNPDVPKNMKIRVMALTACRLTYERLGYMTAAIPFGEVYTSIQTGIVDGQMGGGPMQSTMFKDIQGYYIHYQDYIEPIWYSVNLDAFNSLTAEDQQIIIEVAQEEQKLQFENATAMDERYMQEFRDYGNEVILLTSEELDKCAAVVRTDVWPELTPLVGKALIYRIYDELGIPH